MDAYVLPGNMNPLSQALKPTKDSVGQLATIILTTLLVGQAGNINTAIADKADFTKAVDSANSKISMKKPVVKTDASWVSTPTVMTSAASGVNVYKNDSAIIDYSNVSNGYLNFDYLGDTHGKIILTDADGARQCVDIEKGSTLSLSLTSGSYQVNFYESIGESKEFAVIMSEQIDIPEISDTNVFVRSNSYVEYDESSEVVKLAEELAEESGSDVDFVSNVYDYVSGSLMYDYDKAETCERNYISNIDEVLDSGKGICVDYASIMVAMLRSQGVPAKLETGFANDSNHAWVQVYVKNAGYVGNTLTSGGEWMTLDPTMYSVKGNSFTANADDYKVVRSA